MSLALVGEILGHSDPKITYRYINRTPNPRKWCPWLWGEIVY